MNETNKKRALFYCHDRQRDGMIKFSQNDRLWKKDYFHPDAKPKPSQYTDTAQLEFLAYNAVFLVNCPMYPDDRVYPTMEQYDTFTMKFEPLYTFLHSIHRLLQSTNSVFIIPLDDASTNQKDLIMYTVKQIELDLAFDQPFYNMFYYTKEYYIETQSALYGLKYKAKKNKRTQFFKKTTFEQNFTHFMMLYKLTPVLKLIPRMSKTRQKHRVAFICHDYTQHGIIRFVNNDSLWMKDYVDPIAQKQGHQYTDMTELPTTEYSLIFCINCPLFGDERESRNTFLMRSRQLEYTAQTYFHPLKSILYESWRCLKPDGVVIIPVVSMARRLFIRTLMFTLNQLNRFILHVPFFDIECFEKDEFVALYGSVLLLQYKSLLPFHAQDVFEDNYTHFVILKRRHTGLQVFIEEKENTGNT